MMRIFLKKHVELICAALLLSITIGIVAPLEMYFGNFNDFWFGLSEIWYIVILVFLSVLALTIGIGVFIPSKIKKYYSALVIAVGICLYMQGNFLNLSVGVFNGKQIEWANFQDEFFMNLVIWVVVLLLVTVVLNLPVIDNYRRSLFLFLSVILCVMQLAGLVSLVVPQVKNNGNVWTKNQKIISEKNLFSVGSEGNVIVIVLDSFDDKFFSDFMQTGDELLNHLDGFTCYTNHSGSYMNTYYAMTSIINGRLFLNEMPIKEWVDSQVSENNYYDELLEAGYTISMYTPESDHIPQYLLDSIDNCIEDELRFRNERTKFSLIYRTVGCKYLPDIIKPFIWLNGTEFSEAAVSTSDYAYYNDRNEKFRDGLSSKGVAIQNGERDFKLIHLFGAHEAFTVDEYGEDADPHYDCPKMTRGVMKIVVDYLDELKKIDMYDKSSIIITADHGCCGWSGIIANPLMLIKPAGATGCIAINDSPTAHTDIPATIIDLAGLDDYGKFGESILQIGEDEARTRYYYGYSFAPEDDWQPIFIDGNHGLTEYKVPSNSNDPWQYELTDVEITPKGDKISHKEFCQSCYDGTELSSYDVWPVRRHVWNAKYPRTAQSK